MDQHASRDMAIGDHGYGRARLWLGMSAVGFFVTLATVLLLAGVPSRVQPMFSDQWWGQVGMILLFVTAYAVVHVPFDLFGGYILPRRYGRAHPGAGRFALGLLRGSVMQGIVLTIVATLLLTAGHYGGVIGTSVMAIVISVVLLFMREPLAKWTAELRTDPHAPSGSNPDTTLTPTTYLASADEGFTGGIVGVFAPRRILLPAHWHHALGPDGFRVAHQRRELVVRSGAWRRGRLLALVFTWIGVMLCALLVGSDRLGTGAGIIELSLCFTLWSFAGLLVLPSLSRPAVLSIDQKLRETARADDQLDAAVKRLDALQDAESSRPSLVETIFHPVPSVANRLDGPRSREVSGFWDVARSSVFLSAAGLGLLGRAVHCNCGRPSLWVFLPTD